MNFECLVYSLQYTPTDRIPSAVLDDEHLLAWFLDHGALPDAPTDSGRNTLDVAAWAATPRVLEQLLQHGGMTDRTTAMTTALHMAERSPKPGRREVIEFLLENGADAEARDTLGRTAPEGY